MTRVARECPRCGSASVVSAKEAVAVFERDTRTAQKLQAEPKATHVCTNCLAVKI